MTTQLAPTTTGLRTWVRQRVRAQAALWARLERIDPTPDPFLHWEPTTGGWRLHGRLVPPE